MEENLIKSICFCFTESCKLFRAQFTGWGSPKAFTLQKLQDMGYLENNKLILKVDVKVIEAVDEGAVTGKDMLDVRGFKVLYSQVWLLFILLYSLL